MPHRVGPLAGRALPPSPAPQAVRPDPAGLGIPDPATGEAVRACVVPNPAAPGALGGALTEAAVIAHCRIHPTGDKLPKSVILRDALPPSPG